VNWRDLAQTLAITTLAIVASFAMFAIFVPLYLVVFRGQDPVGPDELFHWMFMGSFGAPSSWRDTLARAAPLMLTALCTALPARIGLVIIGGEGALVLGGLASAIAGVALQGAPTFVGQLGMVAAGMTAGGLLMMFVGALRYFRGVNETISSLLMTYIAIAFFKFLVVGPMRDLSNPISGNLPSTRPIPDAFKFGDDMLGLGVHWGLGFGVIFCIVTWILMYHTTFGFAAGMIGGNLRAAQGAGVSVGRIFLITTFLAGAAPGLAGMVQVAAVTGGTANDTLLLNYGFTGILIAFLARHNPLAVIPVAILFGGLKASSGAMQGNITGMSDAMIDVLMGTIFVMILSLETLYGRLKLFQPKEVQEAAVPA
jgi:simple sugar transport system permease protein